MKALFAAGKIIVVTGLVNLLLLGIGLILMFLLGIFLTPRGSTDQQLDVYLVLFGFLFFLFMWMMNLFCWARALSPENRVAFTVMAALGGCLSAGSVALYIYLIESSLATIILVVPMSIFLAGVVLVIWALSYWFHQYPGQ